MIFAAVGEVSNSTGKSGELLLKDCPMTVTFSDIGDPKTVEKLNKDLLFAILPMD